MEGSLVLPQVTSSQSEMSPGGRRRPAVASALSSSFHLPSLRGELGLRQHALKTAFQALCPLEHSQSALELISDGMSFVSKELKVVSFYVFVFMA